MTKTLTSLPKTSTFQFRINPQVRERAEAVYAGCGLTLTDAINIFIQQSINVDGLPFVVTRKSKAAKYEQAVTRLMSEIAVGVASAEEDGWIDESDILSEFGAKKLVPVPGCVCGFWQKRIYFLSKMCMALLLSCQKCAILCD